jgi:hypothetical protein
VRSYLAPHDVDVCRSPGECRLFAIAGIGRLELFGESSLSDAVQKCAAGWPAIWAKHGFLVCFEGLFLELLNRRIGG